MSTSLALTGQVVVVIGGSSGVGRQTARLAHDEGADIILTGRDPERLERAAAELGALSTSAFDATDPAALRRFFTGLPGQVDHVMITAASQYYAPLAEIDFDAARRNLDEQLLLPLQIGRDAAGRVRPGGTLIFMTGTRARRPGPGMAIAAIASAAVPAMAANLAVEIAPVRVNLIAAGLVDDAASLAVQLMVNTAVTGATYDIDGGEQFVAS
jgi:NAD(P)-dependent dehydrogenase (short-subunit alcohol dehydrogenase family)